MKHEFYCISGLEWLHAESLFYMTNVEIQYSVFFPYHLEYRSNALCIFNKRILYAL